MISPCMDCEERAVGCHSVCPKSERGEYGYKEWKADEEEKKKSRPQYVPRTPAHERAIRNKKRRD